MFTLFSRQRRRLVLFALLAAFPLAALIFVSVLPASGPFKALAFASATALCLMAIPALILRFAPQFRSICEGSILGVSLGVALQLATLPLANIAPFTAWHGLAGLALLVIFFAFDLPNKLLPTRTYTGTCNFKTHQSTYTLWADHLPDPGLLDRHWTDELHDLVIDKHNPLVRIATYQTPEGKMKQRQEITEETTYASFAYDFTQLLDDGSDGPTGGYAMSIADHGASRDVTISHRIDALPFMAWLSTWLDDIVGDECDHHRARALNASDTSMTGRRHSKAAHRLVGPVAPQPA